MTGQRRGITLNRPDRYNGLSLAMLQELQRALLHLGDDDRVRAIVLAGAGAGFSAGHDLSEMMGRDDAFYASCSTPART